MSKRFSLAILVLALAIAACSLPGGVTQPLDPGAVFTAAALTVQAAMTQTALANGSAPATATIAPATDTLAPGVPSPTNTPLPCNAVAFVNDVTVPDGTHMLPNEAFTKTWRLKNTGTCTWTSGYQLVFDHGDAMGGPASKQLTTGTVPPGATFDASVDLVAPGSNGNYRGYWKLKEPGGVLFGLSTGPFWADIKVVAPGPTPTPTLIPLPPPAIALSIDLPMIPAQSGAVYASGGTLAYPNVGDNLTNDISQGFVSFDMSGIPAGSTIIQVKIDFSDYDKLGNPFGGLGCLRVYSQNFGASVGAGDYFSGAPLDALDRWCNEGELSAVLVEDSFKSVVQSKVGSSRVQFRFQFKDTPTDHDGVIDMVRFGTHIKLIVKYSP